ncbi:hypothetical protein [Echinicola marina]|uniref:hypothetical protein n=1 Tax=Echinicola marina TaxID=2859768 RepID=UPI003743685C
MKKHPLHFSITYRDLRTILVNGFPYQIHYRIEEEDKLIIVFGITHTSRNPRVWKNRR